MSLTDAARLLVAAAQRVMSMVEEAEVAPERQRGKPLGRLAVAAFPTVACGLLPPVLADLAAAYPALGIRMAEADARLSVELMGRGVVALAVAHDRDIAPLSAPEGLERAVIGDDACDVPVSAGHPPAARNSLVRRDVARER